MRAVPIRSQKVIRSGSTVQGRALDVAETSSSEDGDKVLVRIVPYCAVESDRCRGSDFDAWDDGDASEVSDLANDCAIVLKLDCIGAIWSSRL